MTPLEYLELADSKYSAGEHLEASLLMWKATEAVFVELEDSRELQYTEDYISLAKALEKDTSVARLPYRDSMITGKVLRAHAQMDVLETCELELTYELAREFILRNCGDK